jgi:uncharacterized protein YbaA (DUF1428 family)
MLLYVDGFVLPCPKNKVAAYRKIASKAGKVWMEYGALEYRECVLDDNPKGALPFAKAFRTKPGETVIFAYITYKSRAHRDKVNKAVMADPRMGPDQVEEMPFDMKRMAYGGFQTIVGLDQED